MTIVMICAFLAVGLGVSLIKDRQRTVEDPVHGPQDPAADAGQPGGRYHGNTWWRWPLSFSISVLMGLSEVWVPRDMIRRLLGQRSGARGVLVAFFFGTAPTGPPYVAFPLASGLLKKGASTVKAIIFLEAWAAAKLPLVAAEIRFLGPDFARLRPARISARHGASGTGYGKYA